MISLKQKQGKYGQPAQLSLITEITRCMKHGYVFV